MMPIEKVLAKLPSARKSGGQWTARCPAHEDRSPSLSISEGSDGRVLIYCHAGCSPEAVCRSIGLSMRDLMPETPRGGERWFTDPWDAIRALERTHGPHSAEWRYLDDSGKHIGSVLRWNSPDGTKREVRPISLIQGSWRVLALPAPRVLYRLPELKNAEIVYVCEGEKAAEAARELGLVATTSQQGSDGAAKADWSVLAGKQVIILPDNDRPGWKYAATVESILASLDPPPVVKIVELDELPEDGGDIADLVTGASPEKRETLRRTIEAAAEDTPPGWRQPRDSRLLPSPTCDRARGRLHGGTEPSSGPEVMEIDPVATGSPSTGGDDKPVIWLEAGNKPRVTDQCLASLAKDFFHRGGQLVRIIPTSSTISIVPATEAGIDDTLNRRLQFRDFKKLPKREGGGATEIIVDAPAWLSRNICQLQIWPGIRHLQGIRRGAFIRPDGSVGGLKPGYDIASQFWVETAEDWSPLETPATLEDVRRSLDLLFDLVAEFPFQSERGRAVWMASLLTRIARPICHGPTPLFLFDATTPASGKSLLAKLVAIIADGEMPGVMSLPQDDAEKRKLLTSALREDAGVLIFDNVTDHVGGPVLEAFLTAPIWTDRILGSSQTISLPNQSILIVTSNNATISGDTSRRTLVARLAPQNEMPELRRFRIPHLIEHAKQSRRDLLIAAIRILQWHSQRGMPPPNRPLPPFGSYEGWSTTIRHALVNAGVPDPVETNDLARVKDEDKAKRVAFIRAWAEWDEQWQGSARQMLGYVIPKSGEPPENCEPLADAIMNLTGCGSLAEVTPRSLGDQIKSMQDRHFGDLSISWVKHTNTGTCWRLARSAP